ncbi:hypothetical protein ACFYRW_23455 [Rhodococcus pyridinivorans]|uniref:hypothetical protein n=1 Tax=Rhodococcus pyridinivorans TaxID=103816 RepID=UPI0036C8FF03
MDSEVVALDEKSRPSFGRLQRRMHVQRPTAQLRATVPMSFFVFDGLGSTASRRPAFRTSSAGPSSRL